jgi:hypothetical protein
MSYAEGTPEVVEVEIADPGSFARPFKIDHQLAVFPSSALGVKERLGVGARPAATT